MSVGARDANPNGGVARLEGTLRRAPWWLFAVTAVAVALLKSGVSIIWSSPDSLSWFPVPTDSASALSYGTRTVARVLGWEFPSTNVVITAVGTVAVIVLICWWLRPSRFGVDGRLLLLIILLGPIGAIVFSYIGGHDVWMIGGGVLLGLRGARYRWAVVGTVVMVLGNPEQTVVATFVLALASLTPWLASRLRQSILALCVALMAFGFLSMYAQVSGVTGRTGYLTTYLGNSLYNFGANLPLSLFAALGISWIMLGWLMVRSNWKARVILGLAVVAIPLAVTAVTLDQTRVFVGVSTATVVALLTVAVPRMRAEAAGRGFPNAVFGTALVAMFLPSLVVTFTGTTVVPHAWFFVWVVPSLSDLIAGGTS